MPQPKAGGSFATSAYATFAQPVAVEEVHADAGMDIGGTLLGMHLKRVAVPVRIAVKQIGEANLLCARTRQNLSAACGHTMMKANYEPAYWRRARCRGMHRALVF